jgi:hypothetical protein
MTTGAGHQQTSRHSRRGSRTLVVLALCATVALGGCSGGSDPSSASSRSASASASPSASSTTEAATASPTAARPPRAPKPTRGPAGQRKFARHVMAVWAYALRTDDAKPLVALSPQAKKCEGCKAFATSMKKRKKAGWYVALTGLDVRKITLKKVDDNVYARASVNVPQSDSYNSDGSFRNTNKAHRGATFEVLMHRGAKHFQLLAFTVS